jgi:hypothetical protein
VDKYGRKLAAKQGVNLKKFYRLENEVEGAEDDGPGSGEEIDLARGKGVNCVSSTDDSESESEAELSEGDGVLSLESRAAAHSEDWDATENDMMEPEVWRRTSYLQHFQFSEPSAQLGCAVRK